MLKGTVRTEQNTNTVIFFRFSVSNGWSNYTITSAFLFNIVDAVFIASITQTRIACWLERRTCDRKVAGSNPGRSGRTVFFFRVHLSGLIFGREKKKGPMYIAENGNV